MVVYIGGLVGPQNTMDAKKDPDEKLREYLRTLSPNFSEEELEIAVRNLKQYLILAGEVARESLRKEKENKSE